jgi:hypothetical protein
MQKSSNHRRIGPTGLKIYWQLLDWEKYPSIGEIEIRLILYKGRSKSATIGAAAALLHKFAICAIDETKG